MGICRTLVRSNCGQKSESFATISSKDFLRMQPIIQPHLACLAVSELALKYRKIWTPTRNGSTRNTVYHGFCL